jgi:hypothetical protein
MTAFWDVAQCNLVEIDVSEVLTAFTTSETSICFHVTTRGDIPEASHLQT